MRPGMWVHILLNSLASSPLQVEYFDTGGENAMKTQ